MFLMLLCLSGWLVASSTAIEKPSYDIGEADQLFEEYVKAYNKSYANYEEKQRRLEIFKENLKKIIHLNKVSSAAHAVNHFTDLTVEEARSHYMGVEAHRDLPNYCKIIRDANITTNEAPDSLDYREKNAVTPVKDQLNWPSCWAFSTTGCIEGQYALKHRQLIGFSEQQLLDCNATGTMTAALSELMNVTGLETETDYPYVANVSECAFNKSKARVRVTGCINYLLKDENKLKEALYQDGPIAIAINGEAVLHYHGGVYDVDDCPSMPVTHAVLLVGYGSEGGKDYWLIKNSWGSKKWGEQGYLRITRGQNTCGLMNGLAANAIVA